MIRVIAFLKIGGGNNILHSFENFLRRQAFGMVKQNPENTSLEFTNPSASSSGFTHLTLSYYALLYTNLK